MDTLFFHFFVLVKTNAAFFEMSLLHLWVMIQVEVSSCCNFTEKFAIQFRNWFDHEWMDFELFLFKYAFFVVVISTLTKFCNDCSIVILF